MFKKYYLFITVYFIINIAHSQIITDFYFSDDTACIHYTIAVTNKSTNKDNLLWTFCEKPFTYDTFKPISFKNSNLFTSCTIFENNIFLLGNNPTQLIRYYLNNDLSIYSIFDYSKTLNLPNLSNGIWVGGTNFENYGFITYGYNTSNRGLIRLNFGDYISDNPTVDTLGNFADFDSPTEIQFANDNKEWIGFVTNPLSNKISRFSFGNSLGNKPTNLPLPKLNLLNEPSNLLIRYIENEGWFVIVKNNNEKSLCILKFGNSLKNNPTEYILPLDIDFSFNAMNILRNCDGNQLYIIANSDGANAEIGNMYEILIDDKFEKAYPKKFLHKFNKFKEPEAIAFSNLEKEVFGIAIDLKADEFNYIKFNTCNGATKDFNGFYVDKVKDYYVNLSNNLGQYNQGTKCKKVVVKENFKKPQIIGKLNYCIGETIIITIDDTINRNITWSNKKNFYTKQNKLVIADAQKDISGHYECEVSSNIDCGSYTLSFDLFVNKKTTKDIDTSVCNGVQFVTYQGKKIDAGIVSDTFGNGLCDSIVNYHVKKTQMFDVDFGEDIMGYYGTEIKISIQSNYPNEYIDSYQITENDTIKNIAKQSEFQYIIKDNSILYLKAILINGCIALDTVNIISLRNNSFYVPNIINPGVSYSAELNRKLIIYTNQFVRKINYFGVYDQLGRNVYEKKNYFPYDPGDGWDGTYRNNPLQPGIYMWVAEVEYIDGTIEKRSGDVALVYK